jgi:hypothetical protein
VILDLRPLVLRLGERIGVVGNLADRLPQDAGRIRIMEAGELERARDATSLFETVATWLWAVPVALWAAAVGLARGRRRLEVRAIAIGLVAAGLLVLVARSVVGGYVVDELATTTSVREAGANAWKIVTDLLADGASASVAVGLVGLLGVWLAGSTASGTAARGWLAPVLARSELTYGLLAAAFLLFVWWGPFAQARRPGYLLVAALLLLSGVEALRRLAGREFPEAGEVAPAELLRSLAGRRPAARGAAAQAEAQIGRLERLARLHQQGVLDDDELAAAKERVRAT